jgi:hypothetical protein
LRRVFDHSPRQNQAPYHRAFHSAQNLGHFVGATTGPEIIPAGTSFAEAWNCETPEVVMANIIEKAEDYVSSAAIDTSVLRNQLSEFLAVERGGLILYERALEIVADAQVSRKFREFLCSM